MATSAESGRYDQHLGPPWHGSAIKLRTQFCSTENGIKRFLPSSMRVRSGCPTLADMAVKLAVDAMASATASGAVTTTSSDYFTTLVFIQQLVKALCLSSPPDMQTHHAPRSRCVSFPFFSDPPPSGFPSHD